MSLDFLDKFLIIFIPSSIANPPTGLKTIGIDAKLKYSMIPHNESTIHTVLDLCSSLVELNLILCSLLWHSQRKVVKMGLLPVLLSALPLRKICLVSVS
jgi:hypothetical protein